MITDEDFTGAALPAESGDKDSDRPGADNHYLFPKPDTGASYRMGGYRHGFNQGATVVVKMLRQMVYIRLSDGNVIRHCAVAIAVCKANVFTVTVIAVEAGVTFSAYNAGFNRYPVSFFKAGNSFARNGYITRKLMTNGNRQRNRGVLSGKYVHIAAANRAGNDPDYYFVITGFLYRPFNKICFPRTYNPAQAVIEQFLHKSLNIPPYLPC
jgi:hypothetical protein